MTKSESPVVVVLSGSMEPAFQRGDILFLNNQNDPIRVGEVVVFKIKDRDIPIVHRVLKVGRSESERATPLHGHHDALEERTAGAAPPHPSPPPPRPPQVHEKPDGRIELLTKGDNNRVDDRYSVENIACDSFRSTTVAVTSDPTCYEGTPPPHGRAPSSSARLLRARPAASCHA